MTVYTYIIVSPHSPRSSNIAARRWEKISKYISNKHKVYFITSRADCGNYNTPDIRSTSLIEIPVRKSFKKCLNDAKLSKSLNHNSRKNFISNLTKGIKPEVRVVLERILAVSTGGVIFHDYNSYLSLLRKIIENDESDKIVLITTYDPWFSLKIGNFIKEKFRKRVIWIADFRDPSFNIHESIISKLPIFKLQTKHIIKNADMITVVTQQMVNQYRKIYRGKILYLPNGYDGKIEKNSNIVLKRKNVLRIVYTGSLYEKTREILPFFQAVNKAIEKNKIKVEFVYCGKDYNKVYKAYIKTITNKRLVTFENLGLISHEETLMVQKSADILLLIVYTGNNPVVGKGIRTGKVYEYLFSGKPMLVLGLGDWELIDIVEADGASKFFSYYETEKIAEYLRKLAQSEKINININERIKHIKPFLYVNIANKLIKSIEELIKTKCELNKEKED